MIASGAPSPAAAPQDSLADEIAKRTAPGIGLVLAGSVLGSSIVVLLGIAALAGEGIRAVWTRNGLRSVEYARRLDRRRATVGEEIELRVTIWNRKALPLAWLSADDEATEGCAIRGVELLQHDIGRRLLRNTWSLAPFERVVRRYTIDAERRGVYDIGPARLRVADLFARPAAEAAVRGIDRYIVWPRTLPIRGAAQPPRWGGIERARHGLAESPVLFAGVREYQPGDPLRRIHHRVSARLRRPVTKRFDPAREREVLVALDLEAPAARGGSRATEEPVEMLCVVAASICRQMQGASAPFGLAAAAWAGTRPMAYLAPASAPGQLERALDLLTRLPSHTAVPFESLLGAVVRVLRPGATVLVITARSPEPFLAALRRMARSGYATIVVATGPQSATHAAVARRAGIDARVARMDGSWRDASLVEIAG